MESTPLRVLLAEDDPVLQYVHKRMLTNLGHEVEIAATGDTALAMADQGYDSIVMDVGLPNMSGIDVTTEIRRREEKTGQHIRIIALTGFIQEEIHNECLAAGADAVGTKPIEQAELQKLLLG